MGTGITKVSISDSVDPYSLIWWHHHNSDFSLQAARASAPPPRRRKRQTDGTSSSTLATPCEPRFIQPDDAVEQFFLIWLCPVNISEPTPQDQAVLCSVLLQSPLVVTCQPPGGSEMTLPTVPTPKETR